MTSLEKNRYERREMIKSQRLRKSQIFNRKTKFYVFEFRQKEEGCLTNYDRVLQISTLNVAGLPFSYFVVYYFCIFEGNFSFNPDNVYFGLAYPHLLIDNLDGYELYVLRAFYVSKYDESGEMEKEFPTYQHTKSTERRFCNFRAGDIITHVNRKSIFDNHLNQYRLVLKKKKSVVFLHYEPIIPKI